MAIIIKNVLNAEAISQKTQHNNMILAEFIFYANLILLELIGFKPKLHIIIIASKNKLLPCEKFSALSLLTFFFKNFQCFQFSIFSKTFVFLSFEIVFNFFSCNTSYFFVECISPFFLIYGCEVKKIKLKYLLAL